MSVGTDEEVRLSRKLHRLAWMTLENLDERPTNNITVLAQDRIARLTLQVGPPVEPQSCEEPIPVTPPHYFSPIESLIVRELAAGPCKANVLAKRLSMVDSSGSATVKFRSLLANLVERGVLAIEDEGYAIAPEERMQLEGWGFFREKF